MTAEELTKMAEEAGFDHFGPLNIHALKVRTEVRDMCAADKCRAYNRNWHCPPACGTLEEMERKFRAFRGGILLQTTVRLEDSFDCEAMAEGAKRQKERFERMAEKVKSCGEPYLLMGTGGCDICRECTYPDAPCRFPERAVSSMEACGLVVSDVCRESGLKYYYGPGTLTYTACVLMNTD